MDISSSQESLPLSQETFVNLWQGVPSCIKNALENWNTNEAVLDENIMDHSDFETIGAMVPPIADLIRTETLSSLTKDNPGILDFTVVPASLGGNNDTTKKAPYVYSSKTQKLYVKKDINCPFYFSVNKLLVGYHIRAMLMFSSPHDVNDYVPRCSNHSHLDKEAGHVNYKHLVQSNSIFAQYFENQHTKRHSVLVPYENPHAGETHMQCLYKFTCFSSCSGGPNRRSMCIVFILENGGLVVGNRRIELKICSCPIRDMKIDEDNLLKTENNENLPMALPVPLKPIPNRQNISQKEYIIKVKDEECYKLLRTIKKFYEIQKHFKSTMNWSPTSFDIANILQVLTSSDEDKE